MRQLNGVYTQRFNRRHDRVGHIFQGRFKAILVERESYLLELCRYVVLNPVRTGTVSLPEKYRWSSYLATAGLQKPLAFLSVDWVLAQFEAKRRQAERTYRQFVRQGMDLTSPWHEVQGQLILGSGDFSKRMKPLLEEKADLPEIPRVHRFAHRPPLNKLFPGGKGEPREKRNQAIRNAHLKHGYSLTEIARHLGFHYTTISKIVNQPNARN